MNNTVTQIQLVGALQGYLDLKEGVPAPVTYAISDIRDPSKRTGVFSKTLTLPGTKRNNELLNYYFDININAGTFDINKVQECILLQDNVPITQNAVLQLTGVRKLQRTQNEDDEVEYTVVIKDGVGDFFTQIKDLELADIGMSEFNHAFTLNNIQNSWSHSWQDGYKYVLPLGDGNNTYSVNELPLAIYAKQYWDKIHADAGFGYTWPEISDPDVRFDDLLIPSNTDKPQLDQEQINADKVVAEKSVLDIQTFNYPSIAISSITGTRYRSLVPVSNFFDVSITNEITDQGANYTPIGGFGGRDGVFTSPFTTSSTNVQFDWRFSIIHNNLNTTGLFNTLATSVDYELAVEFGFATSSGALTRYEIKNGWLLTPSTSFPNGATTITSSFAGGASVQIPYLSSGEHMWVEVRLKAINVITGQESLIDMTRAHSWDLIMEDFKWTITADPSATIVGYTVDMQKFIPEKIKQADFIKSIYTMYNLYPVPDENNPTIINYVSRDKFYDSGKSVDWTDKLDRSTEQVLEFIPELSNKRLRLTYKDDDDGYNEAYTGQIGKTYGEVEFIFNNEYVKGTDTKEIIFSPTPNVSTYWGANLPTIPIGQKHNVRILLDNGFKPTSAPYTIYETLSGGLTPIGGSYLVYPHTSHFDSITNPGFDINFGVCDYYFYPVNSYTLNNLGSLYWARTFAQINTGKLLTAYFNLSPSDIEKMELNDKIRIDNSYWNINKIVDYDASSRRLTKVELISIEDEARLPNFGTTGKVIDDEYPQPPTPPVVDGSILDELRKLSYFEKQRLAKRNAIINSDRNVYIGGKNGIITPGFEGVIFGDNINALESGYYIGNTVYSQNGPIYTKGIIIDGGVDLYALDRTRTNDIMIIDGTNDAITNGTPMPIDDDLNWGRPIIKGGQDGAYYK